MLQETNKHMAAAAISIEMLKSQSECAIPGQLDSCKSHYGGLHSYGANKSFHALEIYY